MREIVLDTETTGLDPDTGHRIVEIGAIELSGHVPTGRTYHQYINPERTMPDEAFQVHGLGDEFLRDKPRFAEIADGFLEFVQDARLVIHNASFDMKFLNAELRSCRKSVIPFDRAVDTLALCRQKFPGAPASLDALCRRFGIDNSARTLHGALLDSEILAEVYLELIGGRQPDLSLSTLPTLAVGDQDGNRDRRSAARRKPLPSRLTQAERAAHQAFIDTLGDAAVWKRYARVE